MNEKGTIYYGTAIEYLEEIDQNGILKPRHRHEQYISVSISAYESPIDILHEDIKRMAQTFSLADICSINNNRICYNPGYRNTLTHIQGFGPNRNKYLFGYYGLIDNERSQDTIVAVVGKEHSHLLVQPDKDKEFEYMSLALHGFVKEIKPEHIRGWIVPIIHYQDIKTKMVQGKITKRLLWTDEDIESIDFQEDKPYLYALYPKDVELYIHKLSENIYQMKVRMAHLKHILKHVYTINETYDPLIVEKEISAWYEKNKNTIIWNDKDFTYFKK